MLVGMSAIEGMSERGGGGACVTAFGREMRGQCLTCGPVLFPEEDIIIFLKINKKI